MEGKAEAEQREQAVARALAAPAGATPLVMQGQPPPAVTQAVLVVALMKLAPEGNPMPRPATAVRVVRVVRTEGPAP